MTTRKTLLYIILIFILNGCDIYTPYRAAGISWGYFTADMNGTEWSKLYNNSYQSVYAGISESTDSLCSYKTAYMFSNSFDSDGFRQQVFYFNHLPLKEGKYRLTSEEIKYCGNNGNVHTSLDSQIYDDQPGDSFKILSGSDSYLQINSLNMTTGEIWRI